jgi:ribosomal protein L37E
VEGLICPVCGQRFNDPHERCTKCGSPLTRLREAFDVIQNVAAISTAPTPELRDYDPFRSRTTVLIHAGDARLISLQVGDRLVLGRSPESPLASLCGDNISSRHAEIYLDEEAAYIVDTGSTNGTFVDGRRISPGKPQQVTGTSTVHLGADPPFSLIVEVQGCE